MMNAQEELQDVMAEVKAWRWTPELFGRIRELLRYADVFNLLRRELTPEEYQQFDLEYCSHYRPQDRELTKWLAEERGVKECRNREAELLNRKRQLLRQKKRLLERKRRLLTGN